MPSFKKPKKVIESPGRPVFKRAEPKPTKVVKSPVFHKRTQSQHPNPNPHPHPHPQLQQIRQLQQLQEQPQSQQPQLVQHISFAPAKPIQPIQPIQPHQQIQPVQPPQPPQPIETKGPVVFAQPRLPSTVSAHRHAPKSLAALISTAALGLRITAETAFNLETKLIKFNETALLSPNLDLLVLNPRKLVVQETNLVYKLRENVYVLVESD